MIRINGILTTPDGGIIGTGSVLDIEAHFKSRIIDVMGPSGSVIGQNVEHDCMFDVNVYRSMSAYESKTPKVRSTFLEFNVGYVMPNIDIVSLNNSSGALGVMFGWLQNHIENGDSLYTGTGTASTSVVYPFL